MPDLWRPSTENTTASVCFLMSGKTEIAGSWKSMFLESASDIEKTPPRRAHSCPADTPTLAAQTGALEMQIYDNTHPTFKGRILGEVYNSEDQDLVEQGLEPHLDQRSI